MSFEEMKSIAEVQYQMNWWGENVGSGSNYFNETYVEWLNKYIKYIDAKNIYEIGCGEWKFMKCVDFANRSYTGFDIVDKVIEKNNNQYGNEFIKFKCCNILENMNEIENADLVIVKDMLVNWSNHQITTLLQQLQQRTRRIVICSWNDQTTEDCEYGEYRGLSFTKQPLKSFNPKVLLTVCDHFNNNMYKEVVVIYGKDAKDDVFPTKYRFNICEECG
jgi:hypothetical protein